MIVFVTDTTDATVGIVAAAVDCATAAAIVGVTTLTYVVGTGMMLF